MALPKKLTARMFPAPSSDPSERSRPWPLVVILALALAGLISPLICFVGAVGAYALADRDQGTLLAAAGLVHILVALTFFSNA